MDLRKIDNLFGRFETFGKTDPNRSTGIGLSLVKEFVDLLHGTIQPESIPGQGTRFHRYLTLHLRGICCRFDG